MLSLTRLGTKLPQLLKWRTSPPAPNPVSIRNYPSSLSSSSALTASRANFGNVTLGEDTNKNPIQNERSVDMQYLKRAGLQLDRMPKHVLVVLDGNRRWCKKNGMELTYEPWYERFILLGDVCIKLGISVVSWPIFVTCTWKRSHEAHELILKQFQESLENNLEKFKREDIKVTIIGQKWRLPKSFQGTIEKVEEATKKGNTLHMIYKVSYGGRWDILEASRSICKKVMDGEIEPEDIDDDLVERHLLTRVMADIPNPDLVVRCGGKQRLSNLYLWQSAYAELYFSHQLYFDFGEAEFLNALCWFQKCGRNFGK